VPPRFGHPQFAGDASNSREVHMSRAAAQLKLDAALQQILVQQWA
jgi:hypothetical protein